jgi:dienelactone hydrolase
MVREALASPCALYFGHGTEDDQNPASAFDVLRAELAAKGRAAVFDRVNGPNHGFDSAGQQAPGGFVARFRRVLGYFGLTQGEADAQ